jgi:hypothetical protein
VQPAGRRRRIGPQQLGQRLAVDPPVGREREDLDQRSGPTQPPRAVFDGPSGDAYGKAAEQGYLEQDVLDSRSA